MWLPLTRRSFFGRCMPSAPSMKVATHGAAGGKAARARQDAGAALLCVEGVEDDEAGVVDPAVGIAEALGEGGPQRLADGIAAEVEAARPRQLLAAAEMV